MDVYLERCQWFATSQECDEGDWAVSLRPLLTEKGLHVYYSTPPGDANNYEKVKTALLLHSSGTSQLKMEFVGNSEKINQMLGKQHFSSLHG